MRCTSRLRVLQRGLPHKVFLPPGMDHPPNDPEWVRRTVLHDYVQATEDRADAVWHSRHFQQRDFEATAEARGTAEAVRELFTPSKPSLRSELRLRPLDRKIVEEIYKEQHGRRSERPLRKGLAWEHWISQRTENAPVALSSPRAKSVFGMGGAVQLLCSAKHPRQFPVSSLPEVAFVGRTNAGKSSLLNALCNSFLCPYGHLPGTTTSCNFYTVAERLMLVDCPGYGYYHPAQCSELAAESAAKTMRAYLRCGGNSRRSRNIKRVFLCASCHGLHDVDLEYIGLLEKECVPFSVILMKTDTESIRMLARMADYVRCQLARYHWCHELMLASSLRLAGIRRIQNLLAEMSVRDPSHPKEMAEEDFSSIV